MTDDTTPHRIREREYEFSITVETNVRDAERLLEYLSGEDVDLHPMDDAWKERHR